MKIIHVFASNIDMFVNLVEGIDCHINASTDINYLFNSMQNYNGRDVIGLIVFANPFTRSCINLINYFDTLYTYNKLPVIIINDNASELVKEKYIKVSNSKLFIINSEDNTISDLELYSIMVTMLSLYGDIYDLSSCPAEQRKIKEDKKLITDMNLSEDLFSLLDEINGGNTYAIACKYGK